MKRLLAFAAVFALLFLVLAITPILSASQVSPQDFILVESADQAYEHGEYDLAAERYEQASAGSAQAALYYNLGNTYYKLGNYGRAVLNYRRAQYLTPRDRDTRANLALAHAQTVDRLKAAGNSSFSVQITSFTRNWVNNNELALLALGAWLILLLLILAYGATPTGRLREGLQAALILTAVLALLGAYGLGSRLYEEATHPAAVIVAEEVGVKSGPGEQYLTEFTLHSGSEVSLLEERPTWVRLALPGLAGQNKDLQGWVPVEAVERLRP